MRSEPRASKAARWLRWREIACPRRGFNAPATRSFCGRPSRGLATIALRLHRVFAGARAMIADVETGIGQALEPGSSRPHLIEVMQAQPTPLLDPAVAE